MGGEQVRGARSVRTGVPLTTTIQRCIYITWSAHRPGHVICTCVVGTCE